MKPNFLPDDFTFHCARKPGPFLAGDALPKKRMLTFVLEICADHGEGRVKGSYTAQQRVLDDDVVAVQRQQAVHRQRAEEIKTELVKVGEQIEEIDIKLKERATLDPLVVQDLEGRKQLLMEQVDQLEVSRRAELDQDKKLNPELAKKRPAVNSAPRDSVDIHLVPSAGMVLQKNFVASRAGGFAFNCDGWNVPAAMTALLNGRQCQKQEYSHAGPATPLVLVPHTELIVAPGTGVLPSSKPAVTADGSQLFSKGSGWLHVYPPQKLPD